MEKSTAKAQGTRLLDCVGSLDSSDPTSLGMTGFVISNQPVEKDGNSPLLAQSAREKWGTLRGSPLSAGNTLGDRDIHVVIPWIFAVADPCEKWWLRLRGNPKRAGEISQAAFLLKAGMMGFHLALPWGDSERYDFVVWGRDGTTVRVQVKGTGRLHRNGYEVQPVHTTRKGGKKRYTKKDIDVVAAHVQPLDAWYLIPIEKVGRAKSLRLHPRMRPRRAAVNAERPGQKVRGGQPSWERWLDAWEVLGER